MNPCCPSNSKLVSVDGESSISKPECRFKLPEQIKEILKIAVAALAIIGILALLAGVAIAFPSAAGPALFLGAPLVLIFAAAIGYTKYLYDHSRP